MSNTVLSAPSSAAFKYGFPFVMVFAVCAWTFWNGARKGEAAPPWIIVLVTVVFTVIVIFMFRKGPWAVADTVEDLGDSIKVTRRKTTEVIPLSNIKDIAWSRRSVYMDFDRPTAFGTELEFHPASPRKIRDIDDKLEALAARIKAGRQK